MWQTEDQGIWVIIPKWFPPFHKLRHEPPATVWIPSLGGDEGDKRSSPRECHFTRYSLKALLHLFQPHTGINWALHGLNTRYPTCLYSSAQRPLGSQTKSDYWSFVLLLSVCCEQTLQWDRFTAWTVSPKPCLWSWHSYILKLRFLKITTDTWCYNLYMNIQVKFSFWKLNYFHNLVI